MKGRLLLVNLLLVGLIGWTGWKIYTNAEAARQREAKVFAPRVEKKELPALGLPEPAETARAVDYREVADKMLFAPDRNPTVVVEVATPTPMPPLPAAQGIVNLGSGPVALMAEKAGDPFKFISPGQRIGEFRLVALTADTVTLEWNGELIRRRLVELQTAAPAAPSAPAERPTATAPQTVAIKQEEKGPGVDLGGGFRSCQPGDTTPSGTVRDGYRKVFTPTPFGGSCRWEPVQ